VFLAGSSMLYHWCEVADLDPARMMARARKLLVDSGRFSAPAAIEAVGSARGAAYCAGTENRSGTSDRCTTASSSNALRTALSPVRGSVIPGHRRGAAAARQVVEAKSGNE
jgi:hypothetical protein